MKFNLGNLLFPQLPPDLRRRRMGSIYLTLLAILALGFTLYKVMKYLNHPGHH